MKEFVDYKTTFKLTAKQYVDKELIHFWIEDN